jgi:MFS transporter, PAT family, beta-lactamase induction signal transducer AmpG
MITPGSSPPTETPLTETHRTLRNPWAWIPTLYLAQGLPFAIVNMLSVIMYKSLGISNADIAFYTAWLYLPWVIKPLWSPVVDILKTRRLWIWGTQLLVGAGFAAVGLSVPLPMFFKATLIFFWLLAFSSATHDIAADGFYMLALTEKQQAFFVGVRSTFFRISMITGQGLLVILAGYIQTHTGLERVQFQVEARPGAALVQSVNFEPLVTSATTDAEPRVVADSTEIQISPEPRSKAEISPLVAAARESNTTNGFYRVQQRTQAAAKEDIGPSRWQRSVSGPLGDFLRRRFGPEIKATSDTAGNVGLARLQLSKPPGRGVVVNLGLKSGDKSIAIAEGGRLTFDDTNWNKPALVVFQLDAKLRTASTAVYEARSGNIPLSWSVTFAVLLALFLFFGIYHKFVLPHPESDKPGDAHNIVAFLKEFFKTFGSFFSKPKIVFLLLFLLLYRFGEAQLMKMVAPFLLDAREIGGLGLTTGQVGFVYGTIGIIALTIGGILGGMVASKHGLKFWLWPMVFIIHLPDAMFIYLSYVQPESLAVIGAAVAIEQFGYGFGFTAYMLYMIYIARGEHKTAHYAICTGFMALGMMIPGMWSGWLQELIGYQHFFVWVILATVPSFLVVLLIPLDPEFGKKDTSG